MIFVLLLVIFLCFFPVSGLVIATSHLCSSAVSNGPPPSFFSRSDDSLRPCPLLHSSLVSSDSTSPIQVSCWWRVMTFPHSLAPRKVPAGQRCGREPQSWAPGMEPLLWEEGARCQSPANQPQPFLGSLKVERGLNFLWWDVCSQVMNSSQRAEVLLLLFPPHCSYKHCVYNQTLTYFRF